MSTVTGGALLSDVAWPDDTCKPIEGGGKAGRDVLGLTAVQRRCLELTLELKSSKEIALQIGATKHSVDWHMKAAMRKLGVDNRIAAARVLRDHIDKDPRHRVARHTAEVVAVPSPVEVEASTNRWSDHDAPATPNDLRDAGTAFDWLATASRPQPQAVQGHSFDLGIGVPWGSLNTLRLSQRLIQIVLIAGLSALAFGSIISSFETLRHLL